jgi:hypothetical protein
MISEEEAWKALIIALTCFCIYIEWKPNTVFYYCDIDKSNIFTPPQSYKKCEHQ